jgi:hypothetical protein
MHSLGLLSLLLLYLLATTYELLQYLQFYNTILNDEYNSLSVLEYRSTLITAYYQWLGLVTIVGCALFIIQQHNFTTITSIAKPLLKVYGCIVFLLFCCCIAFGAALPSFQTPLQFSSLIFTIYSDPTLLFCNHVTVIILTFMLASKDNTMAFHIIIGILALLWCSTYLVILDWQTIWQMWPFTHLVASNAAGILGIGIITMQMLCRRNKS